MPWKECSAMSLREEFIALSASEDCSMSVLCRRMGISRQTGYKWIRRFQEGSTAALADRSRRPHCSPNQTGPELEASVVKLRQQHRAWGGRKIKRRLADLGHSGVCSPGTITRILHRHHLIEPSASRSHRAFTSFEYPAPNDLWQMDFKGHFGLNSGARCHPLTVLDDHSRYSVLLKSCGDQKTSTVKNHLISAFEKYGLPTRILCDNGSPWGTCAGADHHTPLSLWLLRLDVGVIHGRPRHPQTQGKDQRFHATMIAELLRWQSFDDLAASQAAFDPWREIYNTQRPHEALDMNVPAKRYCVSSRNYPRVLPEVVYPNTDLTRKVSANSGIILNGKRYGIGKAFRGQNIGLRPTAIDGVWDVFYCRHRVVGLDQRTGGPMTRNASDPLAGFVNQPIQK